MDGLSLIAVAVALAMDAFAVAIGASIRLGHVSVRQVFRFGWHFGLFQALTSIQVMTLTFVPKLGVMLAVFWVSMCFMTATLVTFFTSRIVPLIGGS